MAALDSCLRGIRASMHIIVYRFGFISDFLIERGLVILVKYTG